MSRVTWNTASVSHRSTENRDLFLTEWADSVELRLRADSHAGTFVMDVEMPSRLAFLAHYSVLSAFGMWAVGRRRKPEIPLSCAVWTAACNCRSLRPLLFQQALTIRLSTRSNARGTFACSWESAALTHIPDKDPRRPMHAGKQAGGSSESRQRSNIHPGLAGI